MPDTKKLFLVPRQTGTSYANRPVTETFDSCATLLPPPDLSDAVWEALRNAASEEIGSAPIPSCDYCDRLARTGNIDHGHSCRRVQRLRQDTMTRMKYGLISVALTQTDINIIQKEERQAREEQLEKESAYEYAAAA